jgi:hypothetical protein
MSSYPITIRRCHHIKVNGTQCGSPALRDEKHCYYHAQTRRKPTEVDLNAPAHENAYAHATMTLPTLEDANSIQMGLAEVIRLLATRQIDHRTAALMLYAMQTASANLKHTSFEPEPTRVVIDPDSIERRPIGATAWSTEEGLEYDDVPNKNDDIAGDSALMRLIDLLIKKPNTLAMKMKRNESGELYLQT